MDHVTDWFEGLFQEDLDGTSAFILMSLRPNRSRTCGKAWTSPQKLGTRPKTLRRWVFLCASIRDGGARKLARYTDDEK